MNHRQRCMTWLVGTLCALGLGAPAVAAWPDKPLRMVVGFAAGGPTDVIARILAQHMGDKLGQTVVVENKTGANSMIATRDVARAQPDGYTVLFTSLSHNVNPLLLGEKAGYDPLKDFAPIANAAMLPMVAVTAYDSPWPSMQALLDEARKNPGAVSYGSAGNGGSAHLAGAMLGMVSNTELMHVPFRGNGPALLEVMAGRVSFMFYPIIGVSENVQAKRVRVLALGTARGSSDFPGVPTMAEVGFADFKDTAPWVGLLAPAGTPDDVVQKLNDAMVAALQTEAVQTRLRGLGAELVGDSPAEFRAFLQKDRERWSEVIRAAGITAE